MSNKDLHHAKKAKNDEFYTQLTDIENEMGHYTPHFKGKTVLCNCDDPRVSNFFRYFFKGFCGLGLKRLISTCYKNRNPDLFSENRDEQAVYCDYNGAGRADDVITDYDTFIKQNEWRLLEKDGAFDSPECIELLKQADIVCTNPPFSLFREYVAQLVDHGKHFIIVGNKNAITYKEIFKLIKENRMWIGNTPMGVDMLFDVSEDFAKKALSDKNKKEGSSYKIVDGTVKGRSQAVWFTNLDHPKRREEIILYRKYTPEKYPAYDNYDAIEVSKVNEIPQDYDGVMGVPITFLDKYNPEQFEIVRFRKGDDDKDLSINGKCPYFRVLIKRR
ncbi:MAG: adenine-specific methyltransferase EcoRI family protein [Spirochaetaceae bacterium]|jgi:hypothetical protein|nr:adenine-specific methyltransferase EcoRI family protein [Spirochaetaceae bacterium]